MAQHQRFQPNAANNLITPLAILPFAPRPVKRILPGLIDLAFPFLAVLIGFSTVIRAWRNDAELRRATCMVVQAARTQIPILAITAATLTAGGILAIVALHMITE
jgi:hypothetical protein